MKSYPFLFWGYNAFWALLAAYVGFLLLRMRGVARRLERIEERLSRASPAVGASERTEAP